MEITVKLVDPSKEELTRLHTFLSQEVPAYTGATVAPLPAALEELAAAITPDPVAHPPSIFSGLPAAAPAAPQGPAVAPPAIAPAPPGQGPAPVAELDSASLPWDGRIHSSGRSRKKDGTWQYKRGVAPADRATVEAELRVATLVSSGDLAPVAPAAVPPAPDTVAHPPLTMGIATPAAPPAAPGAPAAVAAAPALHQAPSITYPQLMQLLTGLGDSVKIRGVLDKHGLADAFALSAKPELFDTIAADCRDAAAG